jgi:hypothetical protein
VGVLVSAPGVCVVQVSSEVFVVLLPELILLDFALNQVVHFGAPIFPEPHGFDGGFYELAGFLEVRMVLVVAM